MQFLAARGVASLLHPSRPTDVVESLEDASMDKQTQRDRKLVFDALGNFQRKLCDLFELFAGLAHESILARDEAGRAIVRGWAGPDPSALESLLDDLKEVRGHDRAAMAKQITFRKFLTEYFSHNGSVSTTPTDKANPVPFEKG